MRILNSNIQNFKAPVPVFDRVLEIAALLFLAVLIGLTAVLYQQAPEQIPTHFNWEDTPTEWGDKAVLWYMSIFFILMMLMSATSAYNLKLVNLPIRLKGPVVDTQKALVSRMSRYLTLTIGLIWLSYLLNVSTAFWDSKMLAYIVTKVSFLLLLAPLIYYTVKIWWIGRGY